MRTIGKLFQILNNTTGENLGTWEAEDEMQALDVMARDDGFADYAARKQATGDHDDEISISRA